MDTPGALLAMLLLVALVDVVWCEDEMLLNSDFEKPLDGSDWMGNGCDIAQDTDAYSGVYSCKVSNAAETWSSVRQAVEFLPNSHYYFTIMIKLLNQSDAVLGETINMVWYYEEDGVAVYNTIGTLNNLRVEQGWQQISGDLYVDMSEYVNQYVWVKTSTPYIEYLVDAASLVPLRGDPYWRDKAEERIFDIRRNDITLNLEISEQYDPILVEIRMNQTSHAFPFGSAVQEYAIQDESEDSVKYQNCFYENFNWAVLSSALVWAQMEPVKGEIDYPDEAIQSLNNRGVPVRGRTVLWGGESALPDWLLDYSGDDLLAEIQRRIDYLVPRYNQSLVHWEVYIENEHYKWFEEKTGNSDILAEAFRQVHALAPTTTLFLNDFQIVAKEGKATRAYVNTAKMLQEAGVPVDAMGIQSQIEEYPDLVAIMHRLDIAASAGLPLWITEMVIPGTSNEAELAGALDDLVTIYFAHPAVHGLLLWGFHDDHMNNPGGALFEGDNYTPNDAGLRWQEMLNVRWKTSESFFPQYSEEAFTCQGFYGNYEIQPAQGM